MLFFSSVVAAAATSSGEFDYRDFKSSASYFEGHSAAEIETLCKTGEHASNDDLAQCSHLKFDKANSQLENKLRAAISKMQRVDKSLKAGGEPVALPFFERAQDAWTTYRDSECYGETYSMGGALERYISFWECMTNITQVRVQELDELLKN